MRKTTKVLLTICVAISLLQLAFNIVHLIVIEKDAFSFFSEPNELKRILVYWGMGFLVFNVGIIVKKYRTMMGYALAVGGAYLMLLGANGGLFSSEHLLLRMAFVTANLGVFLYILCRIDKAGCCQADKSQSEQLTSV